MFRLYGYIPELKLIKKDNNEEKIIDAIAKYIHKVDHIQFTIIYNDGSSDTAYKIILSDKDFMDYIQEYVTTKKPLTRRLKKWVYTSYLKMVM